MGRKDCERWGGARDILGVCLGFHCMDASVAMIGNDRKVFISYLYLFLLFNGQKNLINS